MMLEKIDELEQRALADLESADDADALERFRIQYLGAKGEVKTMMGGIKDVPKDRKRDFGQRANAARQAIQQAFDQKKQALGGGGKKARGPMVDVTEPGEPPRLGRRHIITQTVDELLEVFARMGFDAVTGPEVEDEYHNFVALNIPPEHPARDPLDNFYITPAPGSSPASSPESFGPRADQSEGETSGGAALMRSQTSTVQIRVMENTSPPVRIVSTGRVYRPDEHDATHYSMFHQIEGLYVDREVSMVDLKTALYQFARAYFGEDTQVKLVPSYFPFTEPSAELYVKIDLGEGPQWMELGGCGMVDPNVFRTVGYDPQQWTGYAFGLGIERIAMRKYHIQDIRRLFENDVRFLRQF